MPLKFTTIAKRDELAERLATLALEMQSAWDQGNHGTIMVTQTMVDDVKTAACVVGLAEISDVNA